LQLVKSAHHSDIAVQITVVVKSRLTYKYIYLTEIAYSLLYEALNYRICKHSTVCARDGDDQIRSTCENLSRITLSRVMAS